MLVLGFGIKDFSKSSWKSLAMISALTSRI